MSLTLQPTHLVRYRVGASVTSDALALDLSPDAGPHRRRFVPGQLPCGECTQCRRALVGACANLRRPLEAGPAALELPARFLVPIDEPLDAPTLPDEAAALAGVTAFALSALAVAALAPGDVVLWLGGSPVAAAGRALTEAAGGHGFLVAEPSASAVPALRAEISAAVAGTGLAHGAQRRILVMTDNLHWSTALALADPGSLFLSLGPGAGALPALTLPPDARLFTLSAYHPDFLPEAFAALRRDPFAGLSRRMGAADEDPQRDLLITPLR
jgi:hypothetical protein